MERYATIEELTDLINRVNKLERENKALRDLLLSAKPIRSIVTETSSGLRVRHYHTDERFIDENVQKYKFEESYVLGFALTKDPKECL